MGFHCDRNDWRKKELHSIPLQDVHISVSRTIVLRNYQVSSFLHMISSGVARCEPFVLALDAGHQLYGNDESKLRKFFLLSDVTLLFIVCAFCAEL